MQLKKLNYITLVMLFYVLGCAKSSDPSGGARATDPSQVPNVVIQKVSDTAKLPELGDFKTLEFLMFYDLPEDTCVYRITEKTTVSQISDSTIEHTYDRTFVTNLKNPAACPAQPTDFVAHEVKSWGIGRYKQMKLEAIKQNLDPSEYQKNEWVQTVRIVSSQELNHNGLRTQLVEMEVVSKKGVKYALKQYVSLDSLFLARFEYLLERTDNIGSATNYQVMISYSVKKLNPQRL
jgi:hypothetical protein